MNTTTHPEGLYIDLDSGDTIEAYAGSSCEVWLGVYNGRRQGARIALTVTQLGHIARCLSLLHTNLRRSHYSRRAP